MAYVNDKSMSIGLVDRISAFAKTIQEAYVRGRTFRKTRAELTALSDRELGDLGIHRSMITRIAFEAAYGK